MRELVIGALGLLLAVSPASAALIEVDLFTQGDKLLTLDTSTGLEWLDLTVTENESYNSIIGGFGGFITGEGFRYATEAEIAALRGQAGIVDLTGTSVAANRTGVDLLLLLMGCTGNCGTGFDRQVPSLDENRPQTPAKDHHDLGGLLERPPPDHTLAEEVLPEAARHAEAPLVPRLTLSADRRCEVRLSTWWTCSTTSNSSSSGAGLRRSSAQTTGPRKGTIGGISCVR
jgi:hypothetical protein